MKQTAIEWFHKQVVKEIISHGFISMTMLDKLKEQAKQMEKDQMMDAYSYGMGETCQWNPLDSMFDHYYNETYKSE